jgi:hypothetical protein
MRDFPEPFYGSALDVWTFHPGLAHGLTAVRHLGQSGFDLYLRPLPGPRGWGKAGVERDRLRIDFVTPFEILVEGTSRDFSDAEALLVYGSLPPTTITLRPWCRETAVRGQR